MATKRVKPEAEPEKGDELVGKKAPAFQLPTQSGELLASKSLSGKPYILYFYPKDNTPGCTQEACEFQAELPSFEQLGVRVIGVSPDSAASHERFRSKYELSFDLVSDGDKELAQAYGVWALKKNYGREYWGIVRSTFLVSAKGVVLQAWRGVRVKGHVDEVLGALKAHGLK